MITITSIMVQEEQEQAYLDPKVQEDYQANEVLQDQEVWLVHQELVY
jgi:hypothetical protein